MIAEKIYRKFQRGSDSLFLVGFRSDFLPDECGNCRLRFRQLIEVKSGISSLQKHRLEPSNINDPFLPPSFPPFRAVLIPFLAARGSIPFEVFNIHVHPGD